MANVDHYHRKFLEKQAELESQGKRWCTHCEKIKDLKEFEFLPWVESRKMHCRECSLKFRELHRNWLAENKKNKKKKKKKIKPKPRRDDPLNGVRVIHKGRRKSYE